MTASPAFFERLIAHGVSCRRTLPKIRHLHTGGAPVFPRLLTGLRALAPNAEVVAVYGSTEAEPVAHLSVAEISPADFAAMQNGRGLLAGLPVPEIALRIVRDRWGTVRGAMTRSELEHETLPAEQPGEIVVTGEHVLRGYLGGVGDQETKFSVEGVVWHRTGDAGLLDGRGRLWLLGRCAARIEDAHGRFYPFAIECVAMNFPEVRRAAVLAHAGARWLIIETTADPTDLEPRLLAATAWAHIRAIKFLKQMPVDKRHNAKIDYPALRHALGIG
jgi:acyl-CoA synthetase (AMP-forming)/AMP-acid ligase II